MKELDIRLDDTLYWGEQEWECIEVKKVPRYPYKMRNKKTGIIRWFTVFGQSEDDTPPVLSFTRYSIEKSGANFERPKEPLRPVDVTTLQKVRFRDLETDEWKYGFFLRNLNSYSSYSYSCLPIDNFSDSQVYRICEPYEWHDL